jgi:acyl-CoA synthetase (AMP-forming)/AMP-acid ligase II
MRMTPGRTRTLTEILRERAALTPDARAYTFLDQGEREGRSLTWSALDRRSRAIGAAIGSAAPRGARVLVMFPPALDFVPAFFGVLAAGAIAVPTYPPAGSRVDRTVTRLRGMIRDAGIGLVVAPIAVRRRAAALEALVPELSAVEWLVPDEIPDATADCWRDPRSGEHDVALLQYTSGSTAEPRGVMVSHANLVHNLAHSARLARHDARSVSVCWLPVNHDMGLIDGVLQPAFSGFPAWLMAPTAFLQRPARWLQAISLFRATHSGGPNFAYDLCVRRVRAEERPSLDLTSWAVAYNGSEPVRHGTLDAFLRAFAGCGFREEAFRPAFGLAESTLLVASSPRGTRPERIDLDAAAMARGEVRPVAPAVRGSTTLVASGVLDGESRISIVDPGSLRSVPADRIGEIWIAGRSVALGYWRRPLETAATFHARLPGCCAGPFLRSGDLGFVRDGRLFVTGRIKDVLIVRGLKHYPQDLELAAERAHPALRPGGCAAFALPRRDEEAVVVLAEIDPRTSDSRSTTIPVGPNFSSAEPNVGSAGVIAAIRRAIADTHHVAPAAIALVAAGSLPKTTSGKLQRYLCAQAFAEGTIDIIEHWSDDAELLELAAS